MKYIQLNDELMKYVDNHNVAASTVLDDLVKETAELPMARMQISKTQGSFLHFLAKMLDAKCIVEVGCFTGYSSTVMAAAMRDGGKLHTCDVSEDYTAIAKRYWEKAGLAGRIELHLGPAVDSLDKLLTDLGEASVDMAFIDADKGNMINYFEKLLPMLRPGGVIVADNTLWSGLVADPSDQSEDTKAIRAFNDYIRSQEKLDKVFLNVADGVYLIRKPS